MQTHVRSYSHSHSHVLGLAFALAFSFALALALARAPGRYEAKIQQVELEPAARKKGKSKSGRSTTVSQSEGERAVSRVHVHFDKWGHKYDEWIGRADKVRLAPLHTYTRVSKRSLSRRGLNPQYGKRKPLAHQKRCTTARERR